MLINFKENVVEWCDNCGKETTISKNGGHCKECGQFLFPCSLCNMNKVNCNNCVFINQLIDNVVQNKSKDIEYLGDYAFKYKNLFIELRPETIFCEKDVQMDFAIFETEEDMNTNYEDNIYVGFSSIIKPTRYWKYIKKCCDILLKKEM